MTTSNHVSDAATRGHYEQLDHSLTLNHEDQLDHSLLFTPDNVQPAAATALISVVAPATLPEGYLMDVQVDGRGQTFSVKVPPGGVEEGQSFQVTIEGRSSEDAFQNAVSVAIPRVSVPVGAWRDGMCDCFRFGCCHPAFWNAFCCTAILIAQVMTRMKLDVLGRPTTTQRAPVLTFRVILGIVLTEVFLSQVVRPIAFVMTHNYIASMMDPNVVVAVPKEGMEGLANFLDTFFLLIRIALALFTLYLVIVTRAYVRNKYGISNKYCNGNESSNRSGGVSFEDCCCSFWCCCCTTGQLARHTMDYDTYRGVCCSDTGVPDYVPSVV